MTFLPSEQVLSLQPTQLPPAEAWALDTVSESLSFSCLHDNDA